MSTPSDAVHESSLASQVVAPAAVPATRPLYWSVRRELWENRFIYVAPLVVAALVLLSFSISAMITLPRKMRALSALDPAQQRVALAMPYSTAAALISLTTLIVALFYCLDALHGERRDRSLLFWKSLPVSDLTTVLSKLSVPLVVLPLLAFAIVVAAQLLMLALSTAIVLLSGAGAATLWARLPLLPMSVVMLYGLAVHALWHAPIYGWLLLVSGWARRATLVWAVLPPLAICMVEGMAFGTSHVASLLRYRVTGAMAEAFALEGRRGEVIHRLAQLDPVRFLSSPGLWSGLAVATAFIAIAVRQRRYRDPI